MLSRFSTNVAILMMSIDAVIVDAALALMNLVVQNHMFFHWFTAGDFYPLWYIVLPLIWGGILISGSLYDGRRNFRIVDEISLFLSLTSLIMITLAGITYLFNYHVSRTTFIGFCALATSMQLMVHFGFRIYWRIYNKTHNNNSTHRVLIVGAGELGKQIKAEIEKYKDHITIQVAGFVDDDPEKLNIPDVLGKVIDTVPIIQKQHISDVIITLPDSAYKLREELVNSLNSLSVHAWVIPNVFQLALYYQTKMETFAGMPMLDLHALAINNYQRLTKRIFDLIIAALLLFFLWPVMLVIAVIIRRDSPGPAIFCQMRIGENGKPLKMYKFRTMVQNAEEVYTLLEKQDENGNPLYKFPDDPRITGFGHFLRKFSLDELPQLFNVIKGEISLIGPRPELPQLVAKYQPWQLARFGVPPGITGWWQVNGRSDKPMHLNTGDDIYYINNYSIWLDIQILLKTLVAVVLGRGAF